MIIKHFTRPGKDTNEDAVYACENFAFVLDGATGLLKENISPNKSDAQWYSEYFKKFLIKNLGNTNKTIKEIMKEGIIEVNAIYNKFPGAENIKSRPSAGIALYRIQNGQLEYFTLGDCALLIKDKNDVIYHILDNHLPELDGININKMVEKSKEHGVNVIEARDYISEDLLKTRLTQNTENGYWILSDDVKAVDNALTGKIDMKDIKQIVGLSDGFSQVYDTFSIFTQKSLLNELSAGKSIESLYEILYKNQEEDFYCNKHPRFKLRDDATLFDVEIEL